MIFRYPLFCVATMWHSISTADRLSNYRVNTNATVTQRVLCACKNSLWAKSYRHVNKKQNSLMKVNIKYDRIGKLALNTPRFFLSRRKARAYFSLIIRVKYFQNHKLIKMEDQANNSCLWCRMTDLAQSFHVYLNYHVDRK